MNTNIARYIVMVSLVSAVIPPIATAAQAPYGPRSNIYFPDTGKKESPACGPVLEPVSSGPRMRYVIAKELAPCIEPINRQPSRWAGPRGTVPISDAPDRNAMMPLR